MIAAPVNTKSLLAHIFGVMQQLSNKEIDAQTACAQAKLASNACELLNYELRNTLVKIKLREIGANVELSDLQIRQIESKSFSNTCRYDSEFSDKEGGDQ